MWRCRHIKRAWSRNQCDPFVKKPRVDFNIISIGRVIFLFFFLYGGCIIQKKVCREPLIWKGEKQWSDLGHRYTFEHILNETEPTMTHICLQFSFLPLISREGISYKQYQITKVKLSHCIKVSRCLFSF